MFVNLLFKKWTVTLFVYYLLFFMKICSNITKRNLEVTFMTWIIQVLKQIVLVPSLEPFYHSPDSTSTSSPERSARETRRVQWVYKLNLSEQIGLQAKEKWPRSLMLLTYIYRLLTDRDGDHSSLFSVNRTCELNCARYNLNMGTWSICPAFSNS